MLFQTRKTFDKEAFAPQRDDLTAGVQPLCNLVVGHAIGCMEDHPGSPENTVTYISLRVCATPFPRQTRG
jgi:hypothetical protein